MVSTEFKHFVKRFSGGVCAVEAFNFKKLEQNDLPTYCAFILSEAVDDNSCKVMSKICEKMDKVFFKFKGIIKEAFDQSFKTTLNKFGEKKVLPKFEAKAMLFGNLTKENFFSVGVVKEFMKTSKEILESQKSVESWKSFLNVFNTISDMTLWLHSLDETKDFLNWMDYFFDIADNNSQSEISFSISKTLNNFDKQLEPAINAANANPSFKRLVFELLKNGKNVNLKSKIVCPMIRVTKPAECAKYFVINVISSKENFVTEFIAFLYYFSQDRYGEEFQADAKALMPKISELLVNLFEEQHAQRRGYKDRLKTIRTSKFASSFYTHYLMEARDFQKCIDMVMKSIGFEVNEINSECLEDIVNIAGEQFVENCDEKYFLMVKSIDSALTKRKKFKDIEITENLLTFPEIKAQKAEVHSYMITESVLKMSDSTPMAFSSYYDYCAHIQKYRPKFSDELLIRVEEVTALYIYAPPVENLKWKELTKFGLFLSCLCTNDFTKEGIMDIFSTTLREKIAEKADKHPSQVKNFAKYQLEICKRYPRVLKENFIDNIDFIFSKSFDDIYGQEFKEIASDSDKFFNKTLMFAKEYPKVSF